MSETQLAPGDRVRHTRLGFTGTVRLFGVNGFHRVPSVELEDCEPSASFSGMLWPVADLQRIDP